MEYIELPDHATRRLSFYLAMEEYVAMYIDKPDCFFMWQVNPSVIFGRNQLIENEVNVAFCKENNIQTYRRKSGGGCVYADMSNIMFSYITDEEPVNNSFGRYIDMVVDGLKLFGVDAHGSGRNDIMIGDRKVSGNAFYHKAASDRLGTRGRNIVHGTMLYDTNMRNMVGAITPSTVKLESKGIDSVRQRIALLKDYMPDDIETFKQGIRAHLCSTTTTLTYDDVKGIEEIEKEYLTPEFIYGNNPSYSIVRKGRIEGVGELEVRLELKNDIVRSATILGDYFIVGDIDKQIIKPIIGCRLEAEALKGVLPETLDSVVNLKRDDLINLLTKN